MILGMESLPFIIPSASLCCQAEWVWASMTELLLQGSEAGRNQASRASYALDKISLANFLAFRRSAELGRLPMLFIISANSASEALRASLT